MKKKLEELFEKAFSDVRDGNLEGALTILRRASSLKPGHKEIHHLIEETERAIRVTQEAKAGPDQSDDPEPESPVAKIEAVHAPTSFFGNSVFQRLNLDEIKNGPFDPVAHTFVFYRDHLDSDFRDLSRRADLLFGIWISCILTGVTSLIGGLGAIYLGFKLEGAATGIASAVLLFLHRLLQQREDVYRTLANKKNKHLEYGNQWILLIQTIDAIEDPKEKKRQQVKLTKAMIKKLGKT